jgi:hypothetical protein
MRRFGFVLLALGAAAFYYCQQRMEEHQPPPTGLSLEEGWRYPYARWQAGEYAAGFVALVGGLLFMYPKGR